MKKIYFIAMLFAICFVSCGEKAEGPEVLPDDVMFVKVKIDGKDYEYSYKLQENYIGERGPDFGQYVPGKGKNNIVFYNENLSFDIQHGCNVEPGKNACVNFNFLGLTSIGKNTDPFFGGVILGDEPKFMTRNYSYYANGDLLPFEVSFENYDPIKFTIEGTFKGKADLMNGATGDTKVIDIEGSFRSGADIK
ncbi:hypothetical protein M3O96_10145 [Aquiflexum sp. TKW24L]|uniref:hypothetical protein n=1 Tax=Aquiflexum sp. TKW24L TaxID=2942212 RepID=UPI0020BEC204|nr:hypothetical protein [Aquiflexum sp. TKW24L]MCL6259451.1 hypothetical protein [Aquiflexum sp. TKW24L]